MTELLEFALTKVRELPPKRQDQAARAMLDVVDGVDEDVYVLSEEENAAIAQGRAELELGELVTEEEVRALLARYRTCSATE